MDSKMKFHIHTDTAVKKFYRMLTLMHKSFECKDSDVMVKLYKTLVCPNIKYNYALWGPSYVLDNKN